MAIVIVAFGFNTTQSFAQNPIIDFYLVDVNDTNRRLPEDTLSFIRGVEPYMYAVRAKIDWQGQTPRDLFIDFSTFRGIQFRQTFNATDTDILLRGPIRDRQISWDDRNFSLGNIFQVTARNARGNIAFRTIRVRPIVVPRFIQNFIINGNSTGNRFNLNFSIPPAGIDASRALPFIGEYGPKFAFAGRISVNLGNNSIAGSATGGVKLKAGRKEFSVGLTGQLEGRLDTVINEQGLRELAWEFKEFGVSLEFKLKFTVAEINVLSKFSPVVQEAVRNTPVIGRQITNFFNTLSIKITATPGVKGAAKIDISPKRAADDPVIKQVGVNGSVDIRAALNASFKLGPAGRYGIAATWAGSHPST